VREPRTAPLFLGVVVLALVVAVPVAGAQKVEIIPMVGYQSGSTVEIRGGKLNFEGSQNIGIFVDLNIWTGAQLELLWTRQDTKVTLSDSSGAHVADLFDAAIDYLQVGAQLGAKKGRAFTFTCVGLGLSHFNPKGVDVADSWKFSVSVGIGSEIYVTERLGMRIHGRLLPTFLSAGSDIFCDDERCYSKVESGALLQWDVALGLIIAI
jgi:opacity protein-like surface antigen